MKIELKNSHIMVLAIQRKEDEKQLNSGFIIPDEILEDEQVSQGTVIESCVDGYIKGDVVFFHKVTPVDVKMRLDKDSELKDYFFIKESDVICKIIDV